MTPSEIILRKNLVASGLSSSEWSKVSAGLRDRAFFSSRVESVRFLETCRAKIAELLAASSPPHRGGRLQPPSVALPSRASVVSYIMKAARDSGIATGKGGLTDPGSVRRASVIVDTNAGLAAGHAAAIQANTYGARLAFPAQELVRLEDRLMPRNWRAIWSSKGGRLYYGGDRPTAGGRMIALKGDPIWAAISRFGQPYPPFDFNSGMGLDDVSYDEAVSLGVIKPDYQPPENSPLQSFNETLEADLSFSNDKSWQDLKAAFGDQIRQQDGKIQWRQDLIREAFTSGKPFAIRLGSPSPTLLSKLPDSVPAHSCASKPLTVTQAWLDRKREGGGTHRDHFYPLETDERNIPLTVEDLELIPSIWRDPDDVTSETSNANRIMIKRKAIDGGTYKMVVDIKNQPYLVTLYKNVPDKLK